MECVIEIEQAVIMMPNTLGCYPEQLIHLLRITWMQFRGEEQR